MKKMRRAILIILVAVLAMTAIASFATPGTNEDPLISLSYINDTLLPEIYGYINEKIDSMTNSNQTSESSEFKVIDVKKGQKIQGGNGCEMILRMGSAIINASQSGGLSDVTDGYDLGQNEPMPANHLIIVPINDGRGITMTSDGKVMIKGTYTLK